MNQDECVILVDQIEDIRSGLAQFELGIMGTSELPRELIHVTDLPSFKRASEQIVTEDVSTTRSEASGCSMSETTFGQILGQIIDATGFVHEDKLIEALQSVREPDSQLVRFSNLLNVRSVLR